MSPKPKTIITLIKIFILAISISFVQDADAAKHLSPRQEAEYKARVAKRRREKDVLSRKEEAAQRIKDKLAKSPEFKRVLKKIDNERLRQKSRTRSNDIKLYEGGKHNILIMSYFAKLEAKKAEVKKHIAEMQVLQRTFNQLVREKIQAEPNVDLSRLLSLSDPNYIDDPNTLTIEISKTVTSKKPTPKRVGSRTRTEVPILTVPSIAEETKTDTADTKSMFIDLEKRN